MAEIKMVKRHQRHHYRSTALNSIFDVLTVRESIENLLMLNEQFPRGKEYPTGLYIETKMYNYYLDNFGIDTVEMLHDLLKEYGLHNIESGQNKLPIIIQCFEKEALIRSKELSDLPTVFLLSHHTPPPYDIPSYAEFADAMCPSWQFYLGANNTVEYPSKFAEEIRSAGMDTHAYLVQDDHLRIADNVIDEYRTYLNWGINFLFTEFPHTAVTVFDYY
jgi:glycerophosphoryl diester phosphodiesterase